MVHTLLVRDLLHTLTRPKPSFKSVCQSAINYCSLDYHTYKDAKQRLQKTNDNYLDNVNKKQF